MIHIRTKLIVLMATVTAVVAFGAMASMAAADANTGSEGSVEPKVMQDCPPSFVCVWEGPTFGGAHLFFHGYETGTHNLNNLSCVRSVWNHTGEHTAVLPEWFWPSGSPNLILSPGKWDKERATCHHTNLIIS